MISYILYICIVLFLTYFGYFLSGKYRNAKKFHLFWSQFHQNFLSETSYTRRPLDEVIDKFQCEGDFAEFLTEYKKNHVWEGNLDFLNKEDNEFLREYFSFLGRSDYIAQKEYFSSVTQKLEILKEKSAQDATRYTDLYIKLGFLLGLIIVIILV